MTMITAVNEFLEDLRGGRMSEPPVVTVQQGSLQGRVVPSPSGRSYYSFQGIPYAKPPLGSLRFKAPQPPEPWEGIRDASSEGNVSAQFDRLMHKEYIGDENCLFLNVYTPNLDGEFLPVMVYIHGGGFRSGSGSSNILGGDYLVEKDVVVVTINYRLGALGFLSLNTPEVPGNAGLKDMVQALRWVKENIQNFGGNSGNITLFGESAGGVAVSMLTASPLTKSLISKAVIQSGTALNSWAFQKTPLNNARQLAKILGCESEEVDDILDFLRATPAKEIVEANLKMHPQEVFYEHGANVFAPVIEKDYASTEPVLTESFIDILTSGRVAEIPIMIGSTTLEFTYEKTLDDLQAFIPDDLKIERNSDEALRIAERLKELYFKGKAIGVETLKEYFELLSDRLINIDTYRYVQYLVNVTNHPIYFYKFDYVGELNLTKKFPTILSSLGVKHAGHTDELGYLFKNDLQKTVTPTSEDVKMRERMLRLWTNFAKSGNPTPDENHYLTVTWLPVTRDNMYYLRMGSELAIETNPDKEKMEFWDSLYRRHFKIWEHPQVNNEAVPPKAEAVVAAAQPEAEEQPEVEEQTELQPIVETKIETVEIETTDGPKDVVVTSQIHYEEVSHSEEKYESISETTFESGFEKLENESQQENTSYIQTNKHEQTELTENSAKMQTLKQNHTELYENSAKIQILKQDHAQLCENSAKIQTPKQDTTKLYGNSTDIQTTKQDQTKLYMNGASNGVEKKSKPSNEIKMVQQNGGPREVIRANDPPEDDLPKNIGVNKFVNFFESLGGKK